MTARESIESTIQSWTKSYPIELNEILSQHIQRIKEEAAVAELIRKQEADHNTYGVIHGAYRIARLYQGKTAEEAFQIASQILPGFVHHTATPESFERTFQRNNQEELASQGSNPKEDNS
jgi:hypothetical protein